MSPSMFLMGKEGGVPAPDVTQGRFLGWVTSNEREVWRHLITNEGTLSLFARSWKAQGAGPYPEGLVT